MPTLASVVTAAIVCVPALVGVGPSTAVASPGAVSVADGADIILCPVDLPGCRKGQHPGQDV